MTWWTPLDIRRLMYHQKWCKPLRFSEIGAAIIAGLMTTFVVGSSTLVKRQASIPPQIPHVFEALNMLRGSEPLSSTQIQQVLAYTYPGLSYPTYSYIPQTSFNCDQVRQFGFYADPETRCQVFRRCEANNYMFSYICPNGTVFNQLTLVCDWFYNVNCQSVGGYYDYTNVRIYRQDMRLFDDLYTGGIASYPSGSDSFGMPSGTAAQQILPYAGIYGNGILRDSDHRSPTTEGFAMAGSKIWSSSSKSVADHVSVQHATRGPVSIAAGNMFQIAGRAADDSTKDLSK